jgi:integrase
MSVQQLPSKRWRAQVYDPITDTKVSVSRLLPHAELRKLFGANAAGSFPTRKQAVAAVVAAEKRRPDLHNPTVAEWNERWLTDPLLTAGRSDGTLVHYRERTVAFVKKYGDLRLGQVDDEVVAEWLAGAARLSTVGPLHTMFNDATKAKAGRLLRTSLFDGVEHRVSTGNKHKQPPTEEQMWHMLDVAAKLTPAPFADYLALACMTAMRPGELDALRWDRIRWDDGRIDINLQWNVKVKKFTTPKSKNGPLVAALVDPAREVLERALSYRRDDVPWVFPTASGGHFTPSTRNHHWNRVRCSTCAPEKTLYLSTGHFFGWYAYMVLLLPAELVAAQLRHSNTRLIEGLYGVVGQFQSGRVLFRSTRRRSDASHDPHGGRTHRRGARHIGRGPRTTDCAVVDAGRLQAQRPRQRSDRQHVAGHEHRRGRAKAAARVAISASRAARRCRSGSSACRSLLRLGRGWLSRFILTMMPEMSDGVTDQGSHSVP